MRMLVAFVLLVAAALAIAPGATASASTWRSLVSLPTPGSEDDEQLAPLDRFVLGWQLGEREQVERALADQGWSAHLRAWSRARWLRAEGHADEAAGAYEQARGSWPGTLEEPPLVLAAFDRERLSLALERGDLAAATSIAASPLRSHEDPRWDAYRAALTAHGADPAEAAALFDAAWSRADRVDRRDVVFAGRTVAHLAAGDSAAAARGWIEFVENLRRPEQLRAALEVWEKVPGIASAVRRDERRQVVLDWLVRLFRREDAAELARRWMEESRQDSPERASLFVFVAEQAYRLRQDQTLATWLARDRPESLNAEQRASLEAYPLGMERRSGHSVELARSFDAIADGFAPAGRAAEARWEAAWMWELSGEESTALDRYERYLQDRPRGPFASAAALRAVLLRWRAGDDSAAVAAFERHAEKFDDGVDGAAALWLAADASARLGRSTQAEALRARLRTEHPASPFWREPLDRSSAGTEVEAHLRGYVRAQERAWEVLGEHFGEDLRELPQVPELRAADRLAELGLTTEAEERLAEWAQTNRSDTSALVRVCALAHRRGLAELLGRQGWILERRLQSAGDGVGRAALVVSLPTPFARTVVGLGRELDVAPELVWALMRRESFYDADVQSIAGAYGLLQLIPRTAAEMARRVGVAEPSPYELFFPALNLRLGIGYLAGLFEEAEGDRIRALASYNAGESNGRRWQERRRAGDPEPLGILVISFSETRAYVYHVLRLWNLYVDAYGPASP